MARDRPRQWRRLTGVTPVDIPGVLYSHTLKAFFDRVVFRRGLFSPGFRAGFSSPAYLSGLKALGVDPTRPRDVDMATWVGILELTAKTLAGDLPRDQALFQVGQEFIRGFESSVVGKALFLTLRMLGPRRFVLQVAEGFRTADSIMKPKTRELDAHQIEIEFHTAGGVPTYIQGVLTEAARLVGIAGMAVAFREEPDGRAIYLVSWT